MKNKFVFLFILLLLTSCSALSPVKEPVKKTYLLTDPVQNKVIKNKSQAVLLISPMTASSWLANHKMAYQLSMNEIDYFGQNQWAAPPSELLQPIIAHALENSGNYKAVVSAPYAGNYDQSLNLQLVSMQQIFTQKPSYYQIIIEARLVDGHTQKILGVKRFEFNMPTPSDDPAGGVYAANQIIQQFLPKLIQFIHDHKNT